MLITTFPANTTLFENKRLLKANVDANTLFVPYL